MAASKKSAVKPVNFDPDSFQISAWGGGFSAPRTDDYYQSLQDAGFTMIAGAPEDELDAAAKHGLKVLIHSKELAVDWNDFDEKKVRKDFKALYKRVGSHPALAGYFLRDEPKASFFGGIGKIRSLMRELDTEHEGYINLYPQYASAEQLGRPTYQQYLDDYVSETKPDWIGYDYYALHIGDPNLVPDGYWENMTAFRKAAQKHGILFRFILLSVAHFRYRIVSESDICFQAFSALAYGAKGIEYFTYVSPDIGNYRSAPLDWFGEKTQTWYAAANVNRRIQVLAPILNRLESKKVYHFSKTDRVPKGQGAPKTALLAENPGKEILAGEFRHTETGDSYILLVNKDLYEPDCLQIVLHEPEKWDMFRVSPVKRDTFQRFAGEHVWLAPGGFILLKLVPKK